MAGLLGQVFSAGNVARRKLTDLLGNPVLSAQQIVGNLNDRARVLNEMTAAAAQEGVNYGPASRQLAGLLAEAYNPIGMMVYHGSPAKFSRFDPTKIGSGEGAQAYGYGHYVAQSPSVAKEYRTALSEPELFVKGRQIKTASGSNMDTAKAWLQDSFEMGAKNPYADAIEKVSNAPLKDKQGVIDALRKLENRGVQMQKGGFEYEIDLPDEQIAKMLDWDKPLSEQPNVLKALETHPTMGKESLGWKGAPEGLWEKAMSLPSKTGEWLYREMQGNNPIETSEALRQAGIPGIRYLDQGSRGTGEGTSNFVVFPGGEDLLTILRRNGGLLNTKPEPWQMTPSQWRQANFNEEINRYLPSDYFDDVNLSSKVSDFPKSVGKVKNFDLRQDEMGGFALFDKGKQIGYADNAAVIVSPEYQSKGLGVELVRELRKSNPNYVFGNQTPAGTNLMYSFHKAEVKKALEEGKRIPDEVLEFYPEFRKKSLLD